MLYETYKLLYRESKVLSRCKTLLDLKGLRYQTSMIEHHAVKKTQYMGQESGAGTQKKGREPVLMRGHCERG